MIKHEVNTSMLVKYKSIGILEFPKGTLNEISNELFKKKKTIRRKKCVHPQHVRMCQSS